MREGPSELAKEREFSLTDLICDSDEEWIRGGADEDVRIFCIFVFNTLKNLEA